MTAHWRLALAGIVSPFVFQVWPALAGDPSEEASLSRPPVLDAAGAVRIDPEAWRLPVTFQGEPVTPEGDGWFGRFVKKHRYHLLGAFLVEEADYLYERRVGPAEEPRLFGSPGSLDRSISDGYLDGSGSTSFVLEHKTPLLRAIALGSILAVNGRDWEAAGNDVMGLLEAHKINWSASGLVKSITGRRRPSLQAEVDAGDPAATARGGKDARGRDSFYSDAASTAFTWMAYTDSVLARRLKGHPAARAWTAVGLYGLAGYIGWSRVEAGRHYLTDVLAGAGAGFAVGKLMYRRNHLEESDDEGPRVSVQPGLVPGGASLNVSVRF